MRRQECALEQGFSLIEMMIVLLVMGIIAAVALPSAVTAVRNYHLHADATAVASYINIVRMRSASQYAPYRMVMNDTAVGGTGTFGMERLCGITPVTLDSSCTGSAYLPHSTRQFEIGIGGASLGTQLLSQGVSLYGCRPAGVTSPPLTIITGDQTTSTPPCSDTNIYFYFNTRGLPVDNTGVPLSNGGNVVYLRNQLGLTDAVSVSIGGRVTDWTWDSVGNAWVMR